MGTGPALAGTDYGHVLLLKIALVAATLVLAAGNLLVLRPRLNRAAGHVEAGPSLVSALRLSVGGEFALATLIFVATAALTNLQTGREALVVQGLAADARDGDVLANLRVQPGAAGTNRFVLRLTDRTGAPLPDVEKVALRVRPLMLDFGEAEIAAPVQPNGQFAAKAGALVAAGPWRIEGVVRRPGKDDARPSFEVTIAPPLPPGPLAFAARPEEGNLILGAEIGLIGLGVVVAVALLRITAARYVIPPSIGAVLLGGVMATSSYAVLASTVTNPISPTQASVERGRVVYFEQCAVCHGDGGRGDGPGAAGLNPKPADLRIHLAAGHTDAQLFDWVTNGFPGSAMPAFRDALGEEDRWNVLNHVRSAFGSGVPTAR
ncbi:MAG: hypothetical protein A3F84_11625 [Candidatus Handelsmanbacteria bacterium RIFCSPLOWO2_12_FULL_64_10]|uniref:Cytochrome c domain-containing protein n=1 Tax=Handelsmanbacteria sp. (strain RIFCSPLOWO2_12_FULL_64_10) TaxID=1817868 RepID=A0A1F6CAD4_HANXR|nr:MAG: hypothetical protein A3F84_11625 [Candidatus Handelsmanbacteria bacterium RIFCSPLOWO2_12_FULL_64_10]